MNRAGGARGPAGWYGKLPTVGDFASRRLDAEFIDAWDLWLGDGLQALRGELGDAWLEPYLQSPPWHFVLAPGTVAGVDPDATMAGVVLPSMDRVGRYFPLTLVGEVAAMPADAAGFDALFAWTDGLEATALDAQQSDWDIDAFEDALASLPPPGRQAEAARDDPVAAARRSIAEAVGQGGGYVELGQPSSRVELSALLAAAAAEAAAPRASGRWAEPVAGPAAWRGVSLWTARAKRRSQVLISHGLPHGDDFSHLFGGPVADGAAAPVGVDDGLPFASAPGSAPDLMALFGAVAYTAHASAAAPEPALAIGVPPAAASVDLLDLFDATTPMPGPAPDREAVLDDPLRGAPGPDDILAMFGASDATLPAEAASFEADPFEPGPHDAGPYDAGPYDAGPSDAGPSSAPAALPASAPASAPAEPDILDLFGAADSKPPDGRA